MTGLVLVPAASASSVTNPTAALTQGGAPVTEVVAGSTGGLTIQFTSASALSNGDRVRITGPTGTIFGSGLDNPSLNTMTNLTDDPGSSSNVNSLSISDDGRSIELEVPNVSGSVDPGDTVRVRVAPNVSFITFGTEAGLNSFQISTNKDETPATTPSYPTEPAAPDTVYVLDGPQNTAFLQLFDLMTVGVADEYGNLIAGEDVSATVAPSGPSGTFPGGLTVAQVTTGPGGEATLPRITANGLIGIWNLALLGPDGISGSNEMYNRAYVDAADVSLSLTPASIPANGSSTTIATATVTDRYGNRVPDETVALSSSGGQEAGPVTDNGNGTYSGQLTSTTRAGGSTITATVGPVENELSGTATLTQTA
ncbi:MAG: Ig-like domain-containing protein, partial [Actinomycetota bacterium]|nr:Ig-like domain-containing protein [Actinomycetota bacterium]